MFNPLPPEDAVFLNRVKRFVAEDVLPNTREWERNAAFPDDIWLRVGELGLLAMTLPKKKGGVGATCATYCQAIKEVAKGEMCGLGVRIRSKVTIEEGDILESYKQETIERKL